MLEKGKEPTDSDWKELDNMSQIKLDGKKCKRKYRTGYCKRNTG